MSAHPIIAVDGTAASGKGTLARLLAETYNGAWLDTGLLYRWVGLHKGDDPAAAALELVKIFDLNLLIDPALRSEEASQGASIVAAIPAVRAALIDLQKSFAQTLPEGLNCVILDGRDIGTIIAPEAPIKFFVDADVTERAKRRHKELQSTPNSVSYEAVLEAMRQRDARDTTRAVAPTVAAPDAKFIDTTQIGIADMLETAMAHIAAVYPGLKVAR